MREYKGLTDYLSHIVHTYGLELCIKDFAGFLYLDQGLMEALQPYMIHKSPFCMLVKSDRKLWDRCLGMMKGIFIKSRKLKKPFYGMCYCGVGEYIVPILCRQQVIGVICVGGFRSGSAVYQYRIGKVSREHGMDYGMMMEKFLISTKSTIPDPDFIWNALGIVSEYLGNTYANLIATHTDIELKDAGHLSNENDILSHLLEYIRQNYLEGVSVKDAAVFCHCSESYINHLFKKRMRVNIKAYTNKLRIEQAKEYLLKTNESIAQIAGQSGFSDPNYFSSVFTGINGITPTEFRKRYAKL